MAVLGWFRKETNENRLVEDVPDVGPRGGGLQHFDVL